MKINGWDVFPKYFLKGNLLEIGASERPFETNDQTHVTYIDYLPYNEIKKIHPKAIRHNFVTDMASLKMFADDTFDGVISSHNLEHHPNPIEALFEWIRVTKPGGYIYMVVPDMRYTFDKNRELTKVSHIVQDYTDGVKKVELEHYIEFCTNVEGHNLEMAHKWYEEQHDIHVHTFTEESLKELLKGMDIIDLQREGMNICILIQKETI